MSETPVDPVYQELVDEGLRFTHFRDAASKEILYEDLFIESLEDEGVPTQKAEDIADTIVDAAPSLFTQPYAVFMNADEMRPATVYFCGTEFAAEKTSLYTEKNTVPKRVLRPLAELAYDETAEEQTGITEELWEDLIVGEKQFIQNVHRGYEQGHLPIETRLLMKHALEMCDKTGTYRI